MADDPEDGLAEAQRRMQAAILDPYGTGPCAPEEIFTGSSRQTAGERLRVYRNGYRLRLLGTMRGLHPGAVQLLGQEIFDQFALDYLDARPPRSPTLARLDAGFAGHLRRTRPDTAPGASREAWIDLLIDVVRYERAFTEVLDGPGPEETGTPARAAPARAALTAPCPAPGLTLLRTCAPVHLYVAAVRRGEDPGPPEPRATFLALARRDYTVVTHELAPDAHRVLAALVRGVPRREALDGTPPATARAWLADWTARRLLVTCPNPLPRTEQPWSARRRSRSRSPGAGRSRRWRN
ncbi:putative DNA-binding domain-containing protein [Streptomyces aureoversilis]|uniref:DNA-binding domain-containing protein n=1 Tax=Streptomyces aureoversilis TaxID=67277 RepID=A0ABW0A6G9_9ACTN